MNQLDEYKPDCNAKRWVGYFDLSGIRKLMTDKGGHFAVFEAYSKAIEEAKKHCKLFPAMSHVCFSDSFIFYTIDESIESFGAISEVAYYFICNLIAARFPVCGAIACGSFYADNSNKLFFGKALIEAYDYEEAQGWTNYILCPSTVSRLKELQFHFGRLNYALAMIPYKDTCQTKKKATLEKQLPACVVGQRSGNDSHLTILEDMKNHAENEHIAGRYAKVIEFIKINQNKG